MSYESILKASLEIDKLRSKMYEDIKQTYPEGTLLQFSKYGKPHTGYVAHVYKNMLYICDSEGIARTLSPVKNEPTILELPSDENL